MAASIFALQLQQRNGTVFRDGRIGHGMKVFHRAIVGS
jgi:hypothetical protein